ncbi:MAG: hypothetical protein H7X94_12120 [Vallitaleaceae bacterium]|nr:hypothetical protein [Vallitaleaceae bacterium]
MEKETLYIPLGLKTRTEIFDGYGKGELLIIQKMGVEKIAYELRPAIDAISVTYTEKELAL